MDLKRQIEGLEKRIAALEGEILEQLGTRKDYALELGKPVLLKPRLKRSFNESEKFF